MTKTRVCELYRHFDKEGQLLYVGISFRAVERLMKGHKNNAHWFDQVARIEIERFPSRSEALQAEKAAISKDQPKYNIWTDTRRGIKCRDEQEQAEIDRLVSLIEARGYRMRKNACLNVAQAAWREIEAGQEPEEYLTRRLSTPRATTGTV